MPATRFAAVAARFEKVLAQHHFAVFPIVIAALDGGAQITIFNWFFLILVHCPEDNKKGAQRPLIFKKFQATGASMCRSLYPDFEKNVLVLTD